jgi:hypothetical protein
VLGDDELNPGYGVAAPGNHLNKLGSCTNGVGITVGASYMVSLSTNQCNIVIRLGSTTGDLK